MRKILVILLVGFTLISGCKKKEQPYPVLKLQYNTLQDSYRQNCAFEGSGTNPPLVPGARSYVSNAGADSSTIFYGSSLDATDKSMRWEVDLYKTYAQNQMDSSEGFFFVKDGQDFTNIFNTGPVGMAGAQNQFRAGARISYSPPHSNALYQLLPNDTASHITITANDANLIISPISAGGSSLHRALQVTVTFSGKFAGTLEATDTLVVTNGLYQGIFIDRGN